MEFNAECDRLNVLVQLAQDEAKANEERRQQLANTLNNTHRDLLDARQACRRLQSQVDDFKRRSASPATRERKPLDQLRSRSQKNLRRASLEKSIGPSLQIASLDNKQQLGPADGSGIRRIGNLSVQTYRFCRRWSSVKWPSFYSVKTFEDDRLKRLGGFTTEERGGLKTTYAAKPEEMMTAYVQHLLETNEVEKLPAEIEIVVAADRGGKWTKLGVFVPTIGTNVQSPNSFLLLGLYDGEEKREFIREAFDTIFTSLNHLQQKGFLLLRCRDEQNAVPIKMLFTGDLKMMWIVFGVGHSSATQFCTWCEAKRSEHQQRPTTNAPLRSFDENPIGREALLKLPIAHLVLPPLHMIQGAANRVFKSWTKEE